MHDTIGCYLDIDKGHVKFSKNGKPLDHIKKKSLWFVLKFSPSLQSSPLSGVFHSCSLVVDLLCAVCTRKWWEHKCRWSGQRLALLLSYWWVEAGTVFTNKKEEVVSVREREARMEWTAVQIRAFQQVLREGSTEETTVNGVIVSLCWELEGISGRGRSKVEIQDGNVALP